MHHVPASAAVVVMLRGLKMYGMARAVSEPVEQGAPAFEAAMPILSQPLKAEATRILEHIDDPDHFSMEIPGQISPEINIRPASELSSGFRT